MFDKLKKVENKSLLYQLMAIALPIMLSNTLQTLYNLVDTYFLGKLGSEALSAPSITNNISNFLIVFGTGFSIAGTTLISQAWGNDKDNKERIDFLASQVFFINIVMSLVIVVLGTVLTKPLCNLLRVPEGLTMDFTVTYMRLTFYGMPFMFTDMILRSILHGMGDSVTPLYVHSVAVILNAILDPIFIFGWGPVPALGVAGAAIATNIARFASFLCGIYILCWGKKGIQVRKKYLKPEKNTWSLILKIGLPSALGQAISGLGFAVVQGAVNVFGASYIAAFGVGNRITNLINMPAMGISQGASVVVGKKLGQRNPKEAEKVAKISMKLIFVFSSIGMALCAIFGKELIKFFVDDPVAEAEGALFFRILSISNVAFGVFTVITGAFRGGGHTKPIMVLNMVRLWGLRVPLSYLLPNIMNLGATGCWWAMHVSNMVTFIWAFLIYRKGTWKKTLDLSKIGKTVIK